MLMVSCCDQSLSVVRRPSSEHCQLFASNDFSSKTARQILKIILQEGYLGEPLPKLLKPFRSVEQVAARAKNRKTFKRLLLLNQKMDFEIIIQEGFLGAPLPNSLNDSATLNKMASRAINRKKLLTSSSAKSMDRL